MLFILIFFLLYSQPIYADDFSLNADTVNNWYAQTIAYSLPEDTQEILSSSNITSITQSANMRRIPGLFDHISGPPDTVIDLTYFYTNNTGHEIDISKIGIPLSKNNPEMGDITNLVSFENEKMILNNLSVLFNGNNLVKNGKIRVYEGIGNIPNGYMDSFVLDSMTIFNPLEISRIDMVEEGSDIRITTEIQNNSSEKLNNLKLEHNDIEIIFTLEPYSSEILSYLVPIGEDIGQYTVYNDNIKTECVVMGTNYYNWTDTNAVTTLAYREDGGWVYGAYVQPASESFCITRTPYAMTSPNLRYESQIDDGNIEEEEEVLGIEDFKIEILPKTAMKYEN